MANGWRPEALPTIVPTDVDSPDISQLAQFMAAMAGTGVTWFPDGDLENFIRESARLPQLDKDQVEKRRQMQMRTEATAMAQLNTEYIQSQQEVMMARMGQLPSAQAAPVVQQQQAQAQQEEQQAREDELRGMEMAREDDQRDVDTEMQGMQMAREDSQQEMTMSREDQQRMEQQEREDALRGESQEREDQHRGEDREHELSRAEMEMKAKQQARAKEKTRGRR
jgi:hypothetical protein